jgi:hypothetical protein
MHYKTNRLNHDFQIAYFIAGSCQTADAAYSILCDLREDRSNALKSFEAYRKRDQAKVLRATAALNSLKIRASDVDEDADVLEAERLEAEADIDELKALVETTQKNYDAALAELTFIDACMEKLTPYRRFAHLPAAEAHEAAQHEEWKLQLVHTAQNMILSSGPIPHDHWATMRMHPAFETEILPAVNKFAELKMLAHTPEGAKQLTDHMVKKDYELPQLLSAPEPRTPQISTSE